ncbi:peptidoglycan DD-metalloendopeptidase family protein [Candidatus Micrarchaeota archaeon]|nr:peptidoglycan DD-metalloendopeptidase family protein [Candidatus Micrarchaeota archaeon]
MRPWFAVTFFALLALFSVPLIASAADLACQKNEVCIFLGLVPARILESLPDGSVTPPASPGSSGLICPVTVSSGQIGRGVSGASVHPLSGEIRPHDGLDLKIASGTPVKAAAAGKVVVPDFDTDGYGAWIILDHGNGVETRYAHLTPGAFKVRSGDTVSQGDVLALSGDSGGSTGPHLHFEVRRNDQPTHEPEALCRTGASSTSTQAFNPSSVNLVSVAQCAQQAESACPSTGSKDFAGRSWKTADYRCVTRVASQTSGIPENLLLAQMRQESGYQQFVGSSAGAKSYMQLIDETAAGLGVGADKIYDPYHNICAGTRYFAGQLKAFGSVECALAAYNAGPGNVQGSNPSTCVPNFEETRNYVTNIVSDWRGTA